MPIAAFGVLAATALGLGALTAADIQSMDEIGGHRPAPFESHQFGPQFPDQDQFGQQFHQLGDWPPGGHHH